MSLDDASVAVAAAVAAKTAKAWQGLAFCCVCVSEIAAGSQVATRRGMPPGTTTCHAACQRTPMASNNKYLERLAELVALEPPAARAVASRLSVRSRTMQHVEVCARAAAAAKDMSDPDWQSALHGKPVTAQAQTATSAADAAAADAVAEVVAASIAEAVEAVESRVDVRLRAFLAETKVAALEAASEALESARPRLVEVRIGAAPAVLVGRAHRQLEELLLMAGAGLNVWMCGPAGSGKTTAAAQVAKALGRRFLFNGAVDTEYKLAGFVDAQGRVVSAAFREAYVRGGVYLFDEVDASMPSAVLAFNAALSGDRADFPGEAEPVPRHPDLVVLAAANTWGLGGTAEYVGRNRMDAAFLDRFAHLEWAYDETLELALAQEALPGPRGEAWCRRVQALRAAARRRGLKVVVSPRATVGGCRFLAAGATEEQALRAFVTARLGKQDADALLQEAGCGK